MALDDHIQQALAQLAATLQQELEARGRTLASEVGSLVEQERMSAEAEAMSILAVQVASARAEADARISEEVARARADVEQALGSEVDRWREETTRARQLLEALTAELAETRSRAEQAEAAREAALAEARLEADAAREAALAQARQEGDTAREAALAAARGEAERTGEELQRHASELAGARLRVEEAERAASEARSQLDQASLQETALAAQAAERQTMLAILDRLAAATRRIDQGVSLSDVLVALAEGAADQSARTALLVVASEGFQPFRSSGFPEVLRQPVARREVHDLSRGLPGFPLPPGRVGFSAPVVVGGQTVAVIYADDCSGGSETVPSAWPEAIEVLARHAAQRLEALTAVRAVQALGVARPAATIGRQAPAYEAAEEDQRARRYARLLVSEIKMYNEGAVRQGRQHRDLLERLQSEIDRARHLYEQRVSAHVTSRTAYFDDELVQTLADGDPGLLGSRVGS